MGYVKATHTRRTNITQKKINLLVHHQHQTDSADERAWHRSRRFTWWERARDRETERERERKRNEKQERENLLHIGTQWHADQRVCREVRGGKGVCECVCVFVMGENKGGGQRISICAEQTVNSIDRDVLPCVRSSFRFS